MSFELLLIDDEESVRTTLAGALEIKGFQVTEAASAYEAIELVKTHDFDLVVSDLCMPGLDGIEGARAMRALKPELPLILITAHEAEGVLERALSQGVYTVVPKPLNIEHFLVLARRAAGRPTVLVVDDQEDCATTMASALESAGIRARPVYDPDSALAVMKNEPIDLAIIDLVFDDSNGVELLDKMRAFDGELIAIGMTGKNMDGLIRGMMDRGAYKCLQKPLDVRGLVRSVARARCSVRTGDKLQR